MIFSAQPFRMEEIKTANTDVSIWIYEHSANKKESTGIHLNSFLKVLTAIVKGHLYTQNYSCKVDFLDLNIVLLVTCYFVISKAPVDWIVVVQSKTLIPLII